jgi:hypothetical protein
MIKQIIYSARDFSRAVFLSLRDIVGSAVFRLGLISLDSQRRKHRTGDAEAQR